MFSSVQPKAQLQNKYDIRLSRHYGAYSVSPAICDEPVRLLTGTRVTHITQEIAQNIIAIHGYTNALDYLPLLLARPKTPC